MPLDPLVAIARQQTLEVPSAVAEVRGSLGDGQLLGDDLEDSDTGLGHGRDPGRGCDLCRDSPATYHL